MNLLVYDLVPGISRNIYINISLSTNNLDMALYHCCITKEIGLGNKALISNGYSRIMCHDTLGITRQFVYIGLVRGDRKVKASYHCQHLDIVLVSRLRQ